MKRLLLSVPLLFPQSAFAESGIKYWYSTLKSNFEYYTGTRTSDATTKVHEFSLSDSSGAFSASMQTIGNQMAAEAGAINAERMKVEKGESIGGPKTLSYTYERAAARQGDSKVYSLRLGSTENAFSSETLSTDRKKDGMVTFAEIALIASVKGDMLYSNDFLAIRYDIMFGGRWGGIRVNDLKADSEEDKYKSVGYLYLPLTGRFSFFLPLSLTVIAEYGQDPITLVRNIADQNDPKIPLDTFLNLAVEFRYDLFGVGLQYEAYHGSAVLNPRYAIDNPVYRHEMLGVYAVLGM